MILHESVRPFRDCCSCSDDYSVLSSNVAIGEFCVRNWKVGILEIKVTALSRLDDRSDERHVLAIKFSGGLLGVLIYHYKIVPLSRKNSVLIVAISEPFSE